MRHPASFAAEFPNDNPELHRGARWVMREPCGVTTAELSPEDAALVSVVESVAEELLESIEVAHVDEPSPLALDLDEPSPLALDLAPEPAVENAPFAADADEEEDDEDDDRALAQAEGGDAADGETIDGEDGPIEIVDDLEDFDIPEPSPSDPFSIFVRTLAEVALAAGGSDAAASVPSALAGESIALAWRAIINGESEDWSACGAQPLDEWAAALIARIVAAPARADQLRRELRARGVAAFGLVIEAA